MPGPAVAVIARAPAQPAPITIRATRSHPRPGRWRSRLPVVLSTRYFFM
jgi:hypothetical protein